MLNFDLELLESLPPNAKQLFYKLSISGSCPLDSFWQKMKKAGGHERELDKLLTIISFLAMETRVPTKQFKELRGRKKGDEHKDYEIKANRLRIYLFEDVEMGKIIVLGELKKDVKKQQKNIEKMRQIKLAYFKNKK